MEKVSLNFGPIQTLLADPTITEIMVNRYDRIFIEKEGRLSPSPFKFPSEQALLDLIHGIASSSGKEIQEATPYMDTYLADGSRVNATIQPMTPKGATLTIRKFRKQPFTLQDYIANGSLTEKVAYFLHACVMARVNIVISGGTGTGKTTFLNALAGLVPESERIVTIEDVAELNLQHPNWIRLESVNLPGKSRVSTKDCLVNALRMRPDRIVVGECRRDETFEMLQAMNTGHEGSMTTVHANSSRDGLIRLESLILSSGSVDMPLVPLRRQMASAIDIIVQLKRVKGGQRIVQEIVEVTGMEQAMITTQLLFTRERRNETRPGSALEGDTLYATGLVPAFVQKFADAGVQLPQGFFDSNTQVTYRPD